MIRFSRIIIVLILSLFVAGTVVPEVTYAQKQGKKSSKKKKRKGKKKRTTISFEDELVEGEVQKPELLYLLQKKQFNFKRLIKLRKNFLPEMRRTAEDVQQIGSDD